MGEIVFFLNTLIISFTNMYDYHFCLTGILHKKKPGKPILNNATIKLFVLEKITAYL